MIENVIVAALALNGILCSAALVWLLRRAARRHDSEWPSEPAFDLPDKVEPFALDGDSFGRYPTSEIFSIMEEHYPNAYERYQTGHMESAERLHVWEACCAIHDARFEIEELCS
ncbi:hypothetical protein BH20GEM1_BH20GEM1_02010 [soil metagenome]